MGDGNGGAFWDLGDLRRSRDSEVTAVSAGWQEPHDEGCDLRYRDMGCRGCLSETVLVLHEVLDGVLYRVAKHIALPPDSVGIMISETDEELCGERAYLVQLIHGEGGDMRDIGPDLVLLPWMLHDESVAEWAKMVFGALWMTFFSFELE